MTITGTRYADGPTAAAEILIEAPPERVWPFVCDPLLMPELSSEVRAVEWLDGTTTARLGARFQGHNEHPAVGRWTTTNTIVEYEIARAFAWAVEDTDNPTATWSFTLEPRDGATVLRQSGRMGPGPSGLTPAIERMPEKEERIVANRLREWEAGILGNLAGIKARAEADR